MGDYRHALRFALSRQANAYGFTLVVWGTGAIAVSELGKPDPADVFAFIGGALVSISLIVAAVFGVRQPFRVEQPPRRPFSAMHLPSVPAAVAAGWGLTVAIGGVGGFFVSAAAAVASTSCCSRSRSRSRSPLAEPHAARRTMFTRADSPHFFPTSARSAYGWLRAAPGGIACRVEDSFETVDGRR